MRTRRDRKRLERAVARAMRPSRRASAGRAASAKMLFVRWSRWAWSWPGAILLVAIAVGAVMSYATLWWSASPKPEVANAPAPARVDEPAQAASGQRLAEVRQAHLLQLQPVLRKDAEKLSEIARRLRAAGRVTDIHKDRSDNTVEWKALFVSDRVLSGDLQNHYSEYARAKERLRRIVSDQEEEFHKATILVMGKLSLPPSAEHRRPEIASSLLEKCLEKGPGMTLTVRPDGYQYTARGRSRGYDGTTIVADDERAAFEAFTSFVPDADVAAHCESLKKRAAGISATAKKLSTQAIGLAEGTTLAGECKDTTREERRRVAPSGVT